jgi:two-component system, sensor histidine kinase and response regulator
VLDTKLDPKQREFADSIFQSAEILMAIVNDILDFSKIEAGKLTFETVDFDLVETVEHLGHDGGARPQQRNLIFMD